jgi:hypothetical protein
LYSLGTLNAEDGSFMFAKIVSETGVFGILFYIALIWWWIRFEKKLRHNGRLTTNYAAAAQTALIFCFVISSFVRSANYFNGGFLLWITTMAAALKSQQHLSTHPELTKDLSPPVQAGSRLYRARALAKRLWRETHRQTP